MPLDSCWVLFGVAPYKYPCAHAFLAAVVPAASPTFMLLLQSLTKTSQVLTAMLKDYSAPKIDCSPASLASSPEAYLDAHSLLPEPKGSPGAKLSR